MFSTNGKFSNNLANKCKTYATFSQKPDFCPFPAPLLPHKTAMPAREKLTPAFPVPSVYC